MAANAHNPVRAHLRLQVEFAALYLGAPLLIAMFLPPGMMFPALFAVTIAGLLILWRTNFRWRSLTEGWGRIRWHLVLVFAVLVGLAGWVIMTLTYPDYSLNLSANRLRLFALIWVLYPVLSALPQELIFRVLFFHRYAVLLPQNRSAIAVNALIFSFAHLMYWSWIVTLMTFVGGWLFARAYQSRGFPATWILHGLAGNMLFAVGMGYYFYSGNVVRPF